MASLTLVVHTFSNEVTIKIRYGIDFFLHQPPRSLFFPVGLVKTESETLDQLRLA